MDKEEELERHLDHLELELAAAIPSLVAGASLAQVAAEYPMLVTTLSDDGLEFTLQFYEDLAPSRSYMPRAFPDDTLEDRLAANARWAMAKTLDPETHLEGSGIRAIRDVSRNNLIANVRQEKGRWARIPAPDACGFCRLLGARGPVYRSEHAALASHDRCKCKARIARPGMTLVRPDYMSGWNDDYLRHREAVIAAGGRVTGKEGRNNIVNSWNRELFATGQRTRTPKGNAPEIADVA
jgi:hypothetical protein